MRSLFVLLCFAMALPGRVIVRGEIVERSGLARRGTLLEQGIPVHGLTNDEAKSLGILGPDGKALPGSVVVEARDEKQNPSWLRVAAVISIGAKARVPVTIATGESGTAAGSPRFSFNKTATGVAVETAFYKLVLTEPGHIELSTTTGPLLSGEWDTDIVGDARGILWGTQFKRTIPTGIEVLESSPGHAVVVMKGYLATGERKAPGVVDKTRRIDLDLRLTLNASSPRIGFAWRLTNQFGHKIWLQRYALKLPPCRNCDRGAFAQPKRGTSAAWRTPAGRHCRFHR